jgi:hypothetical protein
MIPNQTIAAMSPLSERRTLESDIKDEKDVTFTAALGAPIFLRRSRNSQCAIGLLLRDGH